jgi:hypothetical protein
MCPICASSRTAVTGSVISTLMLMAYLLRRVREEGKAIAINRRGFPFFAQTAD